MKRDYRGGWNALADSSSSLSVPANITARPPGWLIWKFKSLRSQSECSDIEDLPACHSGTDMPPQQIPGWEQHMQYPMRMLAATLDVAFPEMQGCPCPFVAYAEFLSECAQKLAGRNRLSSQDASPTPEHRSNGKVSKAAFKGPRCPVARFLEYLRANKVVASLNGGRAAGFVTNPLEVRLHAASADLHDQPNGFLSAH